MALDAVLAVDEFPLSLDYVSLRNMLETPVIPIYDTSNTPFTSTTSTIISDKLLKFYKHSLEILLPCMYASYFDLNSY